VLRTKKISFGGNLNGRFQAAPSKVRPSLKGRGPGLNEVKKKKNAVEMFPGRFPFLKVFEVEKVIQFPENN